MRTLGLPVIALGLAVLTGCGADAAGAPTPAATDHATAAAPPPEPAPAPTRVSRLAEGSMRELPIGRRLRLPDGTSAVLEGVSGTDGVEAGEVELVVRGGPDELRADIAGGWTPTLIAPSVALGQAGEGYLVSQEGGDSRTLTLYVPRRDQLVAATVTGGVPFGGGFRPGDAAGFRTWIGPHGAGLFTRIAEQPGANRYQVFSWEVVESGAARGTDRPEVALVPTQEGAFCLNVREAWLRCGDGETTPGGAARP